MWSVMTKEHKRLPLGMQAAVQGIDKRWMRLVIKDQV